MGHANRRLGQELTHNFHPVNPMCRFICSSFRKQARDYFGKIGGVQDRTIQKYGARKLVIPVRILGVNGHLIPVSAMLHAAVWLWMGGIGPEFARYFFCEQMVLIPELRNSRVR